MKSFVARRAALLPGVRPRRIAIWFAAAIVACSADPGFGGRSSADWMRQLADTDAESRATAANALGRVLQLQPNSPRVIEALVTALADTSDVVRLAAGTALATDGVKSPAAAPLLAAMLGDSAHVIIRAGAAGLLGSVQTAAPTAVAALTRALRDGSADVRIAAARSLGILGPAAASATPALSQLLDDPLPNLRLKAVEAVMRIRASPPIAIPIFVRALSDSAPGVRAAAAYALGGLGAHALPALNPLIERLSDTEPSVRREAAFAIAQLGASAIAAAPALIALQERDTSAWVSAAVNDALASVRGLPRRAEPLREPSKLQKCARGKSSTPAC